MITHIPHHENGRKGKFYILPYKENIKVIHFSSLSNSRKTTKRRGFLSYSGQEGGALQHSERSFYYASNSTRENVFYAILLKWNIFPGCRSRTVLQNGKFRPRLNSWQISKRRNKRNVTMASRIPKPEFCKFCHTFSLSGWVSNIIYRLRHLANTRSNCDHIINSRPI